MSTGAGEHLHQKKGGPIAMGVGLIVSVAIAVVGWVLWSQNTAKDAGHEVLKVRIEAVEETDVEQNATLKQVVINQERILTNQENFTKTLERIEKKLP